MSVKALVVGSPINHSLSPLIHNTAYELLNFNGEYSRAEVKSGGLRAFLDSDQASEISAISVTMPLKEEAHELANTLDQFSTITQSTNTLIRNPMGWSGFNTDVVGIETLLEDLGLHDSGNQTVSILGAGATARSALAAVSGFANRVVYRRSPSRDAQLENVDSGVQIHSWESLRDGLYADLLISTVPSNAIDFNLETMEIDSLLDAIYSPWVPPLTQYFQKRGIPVVTGADLLLAQALEQIHLLTGLEFDPRRLAEAIRPTLIEAINRPQAH